ncbi:MAG TPA: hypothetical protein VG826_28010 [Pirellulales bacterium]|nr:hypothetical protein [Pirellulales bacterium]
MSCSTALALIPPSAGLGDDPKSVAAVVTSYFHNSHADVIVSRLLEGYTLDGQGERPNLKLVSLYTDQVPLNDKSRELAARYGFKIYPSVAEALTLGTGKLAVDGVLLVAEHGDYPRSPTGQIVYPKRRLFDQIATVFRTSDRAVPLFCDKHLADNWQDAKWLYDTAKELGAPLMAGSSLPVLWRYPPVDVERGAALREIVGVSYHTLDAYGFHGLEMLQSLAERRAGGETGIRAVTCVTGNAVWQEAGRLYDPALLETAMARLRDRRGGGKPLAEVVPEPVLFHIEYADGLITNLLTLNGAVAEWAAAWRYTDDRVASTLFWTQEARPLMHFTYLVKGIDAMLQTGRPTWPADRTLLSSGTLDSLLISKERGGQRLETPQLLIRYQTDWNWQQPPEPPPGRPFTEQ